MIYFLNSMNLNLKNKSILITGATGSFGKTFLNKLINNHGSDLKSVIIFSRDELKQFDLKESFTKNQNKKLIYRIGDIRDYDRVKEVSTNVDIIIHAAALKQVPASEYNPYEFIKTNILGSENIIRAANENKIIKVVALSTDKACSPINLYGATKLCSDKLFTTANNISGETCFAVVRYGNVLGSRGSVFPIFLNQAKSGYFTVTDKRMTRFHITLDEAVEMVMWSIKNMLGGEIFVPKIPSYRIIDVVKAMNPNNKIKFIGIRPGEKIHEEMISSSDSFYTVDLGKYYAIISNSGKYTTNDYARKFNKKLVNEGFSYRSDTNDYFLNISQIKRIIKKEFSF